MEQFIEDNEKGKDISQLKPSYKLPQAPQKPNTMNRRSLLLKDFIEAINPERVGTKFPPIKTKIQKMRFGMKVAHLNQAELEHFYSMCKDYKQKTGNFSKCFYGALKTVDRKFD